MSSEDEKFQAMAASDIGLAVNGQIVAECAGLQLPTVQFEFWSLDRSGSWAFDQKLL